MTRLTYVLLFAIAVSSASAARAQDACLALADQIRAMSPPAWGKDRPFTALLALDHLPRGVLRVSPGRSLTRQEIVDVIRDEFKATPAFLAQVTRMSGIRAERFVLHRFGQSSLYAIESDDGHFQYFTYFAVTPEGRADTTAESSAIQTPSCIFSDGAIRIGDVGGLPAIICELGTDQNQEVTLFQPQAGLWQQSCRIGLHFGAQLRLVEQFCSGMNCASAHEKVLAQLRQYEEKPFDQANLSIWRSEKYQRLEKLASEPQLYVGPPYFNEPNTNAPVYTNERAAVLKPFVLDGETYVAKLGHANLGLNNWRVLPDYLFSIYRLANDQLEPVAGFYIVKTLTAPFEVNSR